MPSEEARRKREVNNKPLIDHTLAEIGAELKRVTIIRNEANRLIRDLTFEADVRCKQIQAQEHLDYYDAGDHNAIVIDRSNPSPYQIEILLIFGKALDFFDRSLIENAYTIAIKRRCHFTNWTSPFGEDVETAYRRKLVELDDIEREWHEGFADRVH